MNLLDANDLHCHFEFHDAPHRSTEAGRKIRAKPPPKRKQPEKLTKKVDFYNTRHPPGG